MEQQQLNMLVRNHSMHKGIDGVGTVNVTLTQKLCIANVAAENCAQSQQYKRDTKKNTSTDVLQSGQSKEKPQESKADNDKNVIVTHDASLIRLSTSLIRISNEQWQPHPKPSKKAPWYSYHFQCWNCLHLHSGIIQSDNQLLEIECKELLPFEFDPLFHVMGKPRTCGRVNHCYGRKIKKRK